MYIKDNLDLANEEIKRKEQELEEIVYSRCDMCENTIYEGDMFYEIDQEHICTDCILEWLEEFKKYAQ